MCGFLENNIFLRYGTPAIVTLFLLQTDPPGPPSEKGKVMWPSQEKVWGPLTSVGSLNKTIQPVKERKPRPQEEKKSLTIKVFVTSFCTLFVVYCFE